MKTFKTRYLYEVNLLSINRRTDTVTPHSFMWSANSTVRGYMVRQLEEHYIPDGELLYDITKLKLTGSVLIPIV